MSGIAWMPSLKLHHSQLQDVMTAASCTSCEEDNEPGLILQNVNVMFAATVLTLSNTTSRIINYTTSRIINYPAVSIYGGVNKVRIKEFECNKISKFDIIKIDF